MTTTSAHQPPIARTRCRTDQPAIRSVIGLLSGSMHCCPFSEGVFL
ncbi:hypothetical protein [Actinomadura sp. CNU-125]|nr:hypothetical protein [Actinomadura sp. CNU-125]